VTDPCSPLLRGAAAAALSAMLATASFAAPVTYEVDPSHTYPSFEADHLGGLSVWRGKFNKTAGQIVLDKAAGTGGVDVVIEMDSVDFGHEQMNAAARAQDLFDVARFPHARFRGTLQDFVAGAPTKVVGEFTLHGVTRPMTLEIRQFKCMPHPLFKRELCGADAHASFQRDAFGIDAGKAYGFRMDVALRIQVEALAAE
jgi:polyisoprenoid-binding protein YceI